MPGATVRIKEESHTILAELARELNEPMQEVLAKAIESYRRQRIIALSNAAYAALREDRHAWREVEEERRAWESTLADGLDDAPATVQP
ncbi:MAG: toxin-antitoxin system protein [Anaerolineae bacterium]